MKTAKQIAAVMRRNGFKIKSVAEPDALTDGMIGLTATVHVQVGEFGSYFNVVREVFDGEFVFYPCCDTYAQLIADARLALKGKTPKSAFRRVAC